MAKPLECPIIKEKQDNNEPSEKKDCTDQEIYKPQLISCLLTGNAFQACTWIQLSTMKLKTLFTWKGQNRPLITISLGNGFVKKWEREERKRERESERERDQQRDDRDERKWEWKKEREEINITCSDTSDLVRNGNRSKKGREGGREKEREYREKEIEKKRGREKERERKRGKERVKRRKG